MIFAELIHFGEAGHAKSVIADIDAARRLDRTGFESSRGSSVAADIHHAIENHQPRKRVRRSILQFERGVRSSSAASNLPSEC